MKNSITLGDTILIVGVLLCTAGSFFAMNHLAPQGSMVLVELKGTTVYKGNLTEERKVTVRGDYGDVRIQVRQGSVAVVGSDCPNKVCVRTGWRSLGGESIICVPNRLIIRIAGDESMEIRGVTG